MKTLIRLAIAGVLAAITTQASATVTWTFYETGCEGPCRSVPGVSFPYALGSLTLPGPTSSGSASWVGAVVAPASPPVLTGDSNFTLSFIGVATIAPPSYGTNDLLCGMSGVVPGSTLCRYDISWSETGGQLDSIALVLFADQTDYGSVETGAPFGLTGGYLATDTDYIDDCPLSTCRITGFWQSDLAVPEPMASLLPEPMSASLLLSALLGLALVRRSPRP